MKLSFFSTGAFCLPIGLVAILPYRLLSISLLRDIVGLPSFFAFNLLSSPVIEYNL